MWKDATPDRVRAGGLEVWIHKRHPKWHVIMPRPISKSARSKRLTKALKIIHGASMELSGTKLWMMPRALRTISHKASPREVASMVERLLADAEPTHTAETERLRSAIVEVLLAEAGPNADASDAAAPDAVPDADGSEAAALQRIRSACEATVQQLDSIPLTADAEQSESKRREERVQEERAAIGAASTPSAHAARKRKAIELDSDSEDETLELAVARLRRCS